MATAEGAARERAIEACLDCVTVCTACADACAGRGRSRCRRLSLDCADLTGATARILSRPTSDGFALRTILLACSAIAAACALECRKEPDEHCRRVAEACQRAERALLDLAEETDRPAPEDLSEEALV